ncbi:MAG: hypothetical protein IKW71_03195, partial [Elusimicrobiaceae bacterium]|nr:hypothetical protein [Elusimicrobiaceae bacterium]
MKKICEIFCLFLFASLGQATSLPDNMYANAMQDEIKRSMKKLHRPGVEKPYFIAYKLEELHAAPSVQASLGALYPLTHRDSQLNAYVWVDIGDDKHDSLGYAHDAYYAKNAYRARRAVDVPKSYKGIRQALWRLTDAAYTFAAETYQQKKAYERTKQADTKYNLPDVIPAKQATYVEDVLPVTSYDVSQLQNWAKEQSALGKKLPFVEQFIVEVNPVQLDTYYLNSRGGFYQTSLAGVQVKWTARLRDKAGFKREHVLDMWLADFSAEDQALAAKRTEGFLQELQGLYEAVEGEHYVGPVLLEPYAAGKFIYEQLVTNFQNLKSLASAAPEDTTAGKFNMLDQRVMAPGITVTENPLLRQLEDGTPLWAFMPVDDEGVAAEKLTLVERGRVQQLPRTTRPLKDKGPSNGHARLTYASMPREQLTNVFVQAQNPVTTEALINKLLARCEELGLDYGYIVSTWPGADNGSFLLQRVYLDGRRETVHGLNIDGLTTRSLRDILALGDQARISYILEGNKLIPSQNVIT